MRGFTYRKGSALLIVLGMLSFMVVSAVGLSIRMRASRLPSSYMRRNIAARGLVKAALARAMDELEGVYYSANDFDRGGFVGVYDDPYPGCVMNPTEAANPNQNGDYWMNRVFMPFGPVDDTDDTLPTVPTLTFEGLAYLPPAIIDDVRALARRTRTAMWHSLPYDSGRYAYCAVNVSDLFDINRLRANKARNSSANGRVNLASLCCSSSGDPMSVSSSMATELDEILDRTQDYGNIDGNVVPFTSLADFNFVAGPGCEWAPFIDYVGGGAGDNMLKSSSAKTANALFITDTWFPSTNDIAGTTFDLESPFGQPFKDLQSANNFLDVANAINRQRPAGHSAAAGDVFAANLGIGLVCLYDYLDRDSIPLSLALPTTEIVPMVVGVGSPGGLLPRVEELSATQDAQVNNVVGTATDSDGNVQNVNNIVVKRKYTRYGVKSFGNRVQVRSVVACPFKRLAKTGRAKSYGARGLLRVWMAPDGMGCRPNDASGNLYPDRSLWQKGAKNGVATFISDTKTISPFPDAGQPSDVMADVDLTFSNLDGFNMPIYYKVEEEVDVAATQSLLPGYTGFTPDPGNFKANYFSFGDMKNNIAGAFCPLTTDGDVNTDWRSAVNGAQFNTAMPFPNGMTEFNPSSLSTPFRLYASLWIQIMDGSEVVDMVPACIKDDIEWYGVGIPSAGAVDRVCGPGTPLMNFKGAQPITFATIDTDLPQAALSYDGWQSLYAVDPRFNFAPEDWFSSGNTTPSASEWRTLLGVDGNTSVFFGQVANGRLRDRDFYMFVSDQEYLQSIGELAFLPLLQDMYGSVSANFLTGQYAPNFHGRAWDADNRSGPLAGTFANSTRFWRTYTAYDQGDGTDPIYGLPYGGKNYIFESGSDGFKLNPYSDDDRVIFAGLIGTPFDYFMASTNEVVNTRIRNLRLSDMMSQYSFSENVTCAKIGNSEMTEIADNIKDSFMARARSGSSDWRACWDGLQWQMSDQQKINDENKEFLGVTLEKPLHGVDRKFLYSFWRDCFANRQQLYLIFVRAEPSPSSVGGKNDRSSSQMGGRAVALVWRDPAIPSYNRANRKARSALQSANAVLDARKDCPPHRTRVLFYHQFD